MKQMEVSNLLQVQPTYKTPVRIFSLDIKNGILANLIKKPVGKDSTDVSVNLPKDTNQYKQNFIGFWNSQLLKGIYCSSASLTGFSFFFLK